MTIHINIYDVLMLTDVGPK